jgi:hypothetical protein
MGKRRKIEGFTFRPATPSDDSDNEERGAPSRQPQVNIWNLHLQMHPTGSLSTHTSYIAGQASPTKRTINPIAVKDEEAQDDWQEDPAYLEHVVDLSLLEGLSTRRRTASVRVILC